MDMGSKEHTTSSFHLAPSSIGKHVIPIKKDMIFSSKESIEQKELDNDPGTSSFLLSISTTLKNAFIPIKKEGYYNQEPFNHNTEGILIWVHPKNSKKRYKPGEYHGTIHGTSIHHPEIPMLIRARKCSKDPEKHHHTDRIIQETSNNSKEDSDNKAKKLLCEALKQAAKSCDKAKDQKLPMKLPQGIKLPRGMKLPYIKGPRETVCALSNILAELIC